MEEMVILSEVEKIDTDKIPDGSYILFIDYRNNDNNEIIDIDDINNDNKNIGTVKQFNLKQGIIQHIDKIIEEIGIKGDEYNNIEPTGIYQKIADTNIYIKELNNKVGSQAMGENSATGIFDLIENLEEDIEKLQSIPVFTGYQIELFGTNEEVKNLLIDKAEFSYDFKVPGENIPFINNVFENHQDYLYELNLGLRYIPTTKLTNSTDGKNLSYNAIFDLNSIYHSDNFAIIQLPGVETILIFKFTFSNTTIKFTVESIGADKVKENQVLLNHGVLKIHKLKNGKID